MHGGTFSCRAEVDNHPETTKRRATTTRRATRRTEALHQSRKAEGGGRQKRLSMSFPYAPMILRRGAG